MFASDHFLSMNAGLLAQFAGTFCLGCPSLGPGGFCGARVHSDCLRIDKQGGVQVSLSASPEAWFETLTQLGEVLHLARNRGCVLGRLGKMPWPGDAAGIYRPNLAEYAGLWAVYENTPLGLRCGLAVRDVSGMEFERILLTREADLARFKQFVFAHQSPPGKHGGWHPANSESSRRRRQTLAGRIPRLRAQWQAGDRAIKRLPVKFAPRLLAAAAAQNIQVRTTYYHPALASSADWTPQTRAENTRASSALEFIHGQQAALHLHRPGLESAWLWAGRCPCCAEQRWRIEIGDTRECVSLALLAGAETPEETWRDLVRQCLP